MACKAKDDDKREEAAAFSFDVDKERGVCFARFLA